jgi:hypothetical protein
MRIMRVRGRRATEGVMYAVDGAMYFTDVEVAADVAIDALTETMRAKPAPSIWTEFRPSVPRRRDAWCPSCGAVHRTDAACPLVVEMAREQALRNGSAA